MIKLASYNLESQNLLIKLKCTCGKGKVFEVEEEGKKVYFCNQCRSRVTLDQLKAEASTYWRSRIWKVECSSDERTSPRVHVNCNVEFIVAGASQSSPYCVLHGKLVVLSEAGGLVAVDDFDESYFKAITTDYRHALIKLAEPVEGLPSQLTCRVVGVRYQREELPKCAIGFSLAGLSEEVEGQLRLYINEHLQTISPEPSEAAKPARARLQIDRLEKLSPGSA